MAGKKRDVLDPSGECVANTDDGHVAFDSSMATEAVGSSVVMPEGSRNQPTVGYVLLPTQMISEVVVRVSL